MRSLGGARPWLLLLLLATLARADRTAGEFTCTLDEGSGTIYRTRPGGPQPLRYHDQIYGVATLFTEENSRVRLVSPQGWSVHMGASTRIEIAPGNTPILLGRGSLRIEHRPGSPSGPVLVVATRLAEVHISSDSRALISMTRRPGSKHQTIHVAALRHSASVQQPDGSQLKTIPEGMELNGVDYLSINAWSLRRIGTAEQEDLNNATLSRPEQAQIAGTPPLIEMQSLHLDGHPLAVGKKIYLSRADIPPEGELVVTGEVCLPRVPPSLGPIYVAGSRDGGLEWERLAFADGSGGFEYHFEPQPGVEYELTFGVFTLHHKKLFFATPKIPLLFREKFTTTYKDMRLCGLPIPPPPAYGYVFTAQTTPLLPREYQLPLELRPRQTPPSPEPTPDPTTTPVLHLYSDELKEFAMVLTGTLESDGPLSRVCLEISTDAGVHWKRISIAEKTDPNSGTFHAEFIPVNGVRYQFRLRTVYAQAGEALTPWQILSDWTCPYDVVYSDARSTERAIALIHDLEQLLNSADLAGIKNVISTHFKFRGRDFIRALRTRFQIVSSSRDAGIAQVRVNWQRPGPRGTEESGTCVFYFIKEKDIVLLDVTGDDPFAATPGAIIRGRPGTTEQTVTIGIDTVYDFNTRRADIYSSARIPNDLGYFRDPTRGSHVTVLGTHDRRLAALGHKPLASIRAISPDAELEYRAAVVPEPGSTYYLRTVEGFDVVFQVLEAYPSRVKLSYTFLSREP